MSSNPSPRRSPLVACMAVCVLFAAPIAHAATRVSVEPNPARLAPSSVQQFTAQILSEDGSSVPASDVRWSASASLGAMSPHGLLTASATPSEGLVTATAVADGRRVVGRAFVRITNGPRAGRLLLTPSIARVAPREGVTFSAREADGALATVTWRVIPETLGAIDASGHFTAGSSAGEGRIVALERTDAGTRLGQARLFVRGGEHADKPSEGLARLAPARLSLQPGESAPVQFARAVPAGSTIAWTVEPPALASVTGDGVVTAGGESGAGIVRARVTTPDGRSRTAVAALRVAERTSTAALRMIPQDAHVAPNQSQTFTITRAGRALPSTARVEWRVVPSELGDITPAGVFTPAAVVGTGTVIAEVWNERGKVLGRAATTVTIGLRDAVQQQSLDFVISPPAVTLAVGKSAVVNAVRSGAIPSDGTIAWSVAPADLARLDNGTRRTATITGLRAGSGTLTAVVTAGGRRVEKSIALTVR